MGLVLNHVSVAKNYKKESMNVHTNFVNQIVKGRKLSYSKLLEVRIFNYKLLSIRVFCLKNLE